MGKKLADTKSKKKQTGAPKTASKPDVNKVEYGYVVGHLEPATKMESLYTGGKILFHEPNFYSACEFKVYVWSLESEQVVNKVHHQGEEIANFTINSDASLMSTYTSNNLLRILDSNRQHEQVSVLKVPQHFPIDMAFSANSKYIALGCVNSHVKIYSVPLLKESHQHNSHTGTVKKIQWHPSQLTLYSIDENGMLCVFDCLKSRVVHRVESLGVTFSLTQLGTSIVGVGVSVGVYDGKNLNAQYKLQLEEPEASVMCLFGEEPYLLFGGEGKKLSLLNLNDKTHQIQEFPGLFQGILMKIMRVGESKLALITSEQNISIVEYNNARFVLHKTILGYNDQILDVKFSKTEQSDPDILAMATNSSLIKLYNIKTRETKLISGHKDIVLTLSYEYPWLASSGKDNLIKLWYFESPMQTRLVATYKGHSGDVTGVGISLISKQLVSVSEDKSIKIWPIENFQTAKIVKNSLLTTIAHDKSINAVKWSPDQLYVATCSQDKLIKIWSKQLEIQQVFKGHRRGVWDVAFHPKQKLLASVSADGSLKIWNMSTGQCVGTMGEGQAILKAQWLFNNQVATATNDGILRLWDIRKSTQVSFDNHVGKIWAMDVSAQDKVGKCHVVTAGVDSKILLWRDDTEQRLLQGKMVDQAQQRTRMTYDLEMKEGNFPEAARLAFRSGYDQMFVKAVQRLQYNFSQNTLANVEGEDIVFQCEQKKSNEGELQRLVVQLSRVDVVKLLKVLQNLNSISRYFKLSNRMLNIALGSISVTQLLELQSTFRDERQKHSLEDFSRKSSDFEEFLVRFQSCNQKHLKRLDQYHKKSYWMDYQSRSSL